MTYQCDGFQGSCPTACPHRTPSPAAWGPEPCRFGRGEVTGVPAGARRREAVEPGEAAEAGMYTVRGLAARLGVSRGAVWKWHYGNRLPGRIRVGRAVRYDKAAIERRVLSGELLLPVNK